MASYNIYSVIEDVNYKWIKDADNFANEIRGKWGWYTDLTELSYSAPFHRTLLGKDHTYFVIDLDPEIIQHPELEVIKQDPLRYREICIRATIDFAKEFVDKHKSHQFFVKLSGSGLHLIQRAPERIDKRRFQTVVRALCEPCSHHTEEDHICTHLCDGWNLTKRWNEERNMWIRDPSGWSKVYYHSETGAVIRLTVDLGMYKSGKHMIRWTYSRNQKIPQEFNYAIPIDYWDADWVLQHMTRRGMESYPPHKYEIPEFSFHEHLMPKERVTEPVYDETTSGRPQIRDLTYTITVPDVGDVLTQEQAAKVEEMRLLIVGEMEETPPCVKEHYTRVMTMSRQHWQRVVLVRYLSGKNYSVNDIALFFRFHINDEVDNSPSNKHKLIPSLKEAYGPLQHPDMIPGCEKMRTHEEFGVVDLSTCEMCTRKYPLSKFTRLVEIEEVEDYGWARIQTLCRNVLLGGESVVIKKATRAGVTTSMIAMSKLVGKKMLVVTPTNRIGEFTIPNALKIAKESLGVDIKGAMFAANKKSCLKLVILGKELRHKKEREPNWGGEEDKIAYDELHYNNREQCEGCVFLNNHFPLLRYNGNDPTDFPIPVLHAEIYNWEPNQDEQDVEGRCAYVTVREHLREIDVMFTTYSKLAALMSTDTEDAQEIREAISDHFDTILLDEVSFLTNQSPLSVPILQKRARIDKTDTRLYSKNIFDDIQRENEVLGMIIETTTSNEAIEITGHFADSQCHFNPSHPFYDEPTKYKTERIHNSDNKVVPDTDTDRLAENFTAFHGIIEEAARNNNIHLKTVEDVLHLLNSEHWILTSIPTKFNPIDVCLIEEPDVSYLRRFLRFFDKDKKQILVTDATLPYVDVGQFLGIGLGETEIGDPRGTNDHQLVIADSRRLSVMDLFFGAKKDVVIEDLKEFINLVCDSHGADKVIIIVPNIWTNLKLRSLMRNGDIPACDMTWYRSDRTVGVECDKRVMICITSPHPPRGSHDWLAIWYHEQGLLREEKVPELGINLTINSTKAAFYQTIGRAKDPECKERSVVYLWGIPGRSMTGSETSPGAADLMKFNDTIPLPHISLTTREESRGELASRMGFAWLEHQIKLTIEQIRIFGKVYKDGTFNTTETRRKLSVYSKDEVEDVLRTTPPEIFKIFHIEATRKTMGAKEYWVLKKIERKEDEVSNRNQI